MDAIIGITGTPGTGKKSIAPLVASALGLPCESLPRLDGEILPRCIDSDLEIDTEKARKEISSHPFGRIVAYGHLLPYILPPKAVDRMVVLRCEPSVLKVRLAKRGYSTKKVKDNVEAELIGLISEDSRLAFGARRTVEFDATTLSPELSAREILRLLRKSGPFPTRIDWTLRYGSAQKLMSLLSPEVAAQG